MDGYKDYINPDGSTPDIDNCFDDDGYLMEDLYEYLGSNLEHYSGNTDAAALYYLELMNACCGSNPKTRHTLTTKQMFKRCFE